MKALLAGLLGLLCCAFDQASAQDVGIFKVLKLEGNQVRWRIPRNVGGPVVTYRMIDETAEFPGARNCRKIGRLDDLMATSKLKPAEVRQELAAAFAMWEAAANISFREAPEGTRADILIGAQAEPEGWAFAEVFYDTGSSEPIKPISRALVCLNPLRHWKIGFDGDLGRYDLRYTFAHEIGHAIGLDHPNGGDQVMGYRYEEHFRTLQPGDVRGAVALYGETRHAALGSPKPSSEESLQTTSSAHRFTKRWGTRGFTARSP